MVIIALNIESFILRKNVAGASGGAVIAVSLAGTSCPRPIGSSALAVVQGAYVEGQDRFGVALTAAVFSIMNEFLHSLAQTGDSQRDFSLLG